MIGLQVEKLHKNFDLLQQKFGDKEFCSIYGAGSLNPSFVFIFMNPTARNFASNKEWDGLRAPWIGTKNIWKLFYKIGIISAKQLNNIKLKKANEWTNEMALDLYSTISKKSAYVTNFAKCTLSDARPISNSIFQKYKELLLVELQTLNSKHIITFGNQVSSNLLGKNISVSNYTNDEFEIFTHNGVKYKVYPTYYPVGQGQRNIGKAIERIKRIIK